MNLALDIGVKLASVAPGPFLQPAFAVLQAIWTSVEQLKSNRRQMRAIAQAAAQILLALNAQDTADVDTAAREEFERTLSRIEALCARMQHRRFVRAFLESAADQTEITLVHAQLTLCVDALKIEAQVSMLEYARQVEDARQEDQAESSVALRQLLEKQDALLELIGDAPVGEANNEFAQGSDTQQTIFRLLEGILISLKTADVGPSHEEDFQEALAQLRKVTASSREDINPLLVLLQPGLKVDVLIPPLKWRMHRLLMTDNLCIHLTSEQIKQFSVAEAGAAAFIDYLMNCEDRPLQYAAVDVFQQDKSLKHFFKQDFVFKPSEDPNAILANLKPGVTPAALVLPLRYEGPKFAWKEILRQQLSADEIATFFKDGAEGVERFIEHVSGGDADLALQYAALAVFREDKRVAHYFIHDEVLGITE